MSRATKSRTLAMVATTALALATPLAAQTTVGEVFASDASVRGSMVLTASGTRVLSGSQVAAGENVALLKLLRGGQVRICRGTSVAISEADVGAPMLFGINTGAVELHYPLTAISDSVVTPDFRIQVTGPGISHIALGADAKGNTCVKAMEGNSSSIVVSESMGEGSHHVAQGRSIIFHDGKLEKVSDNDNDCGCPAPPPKLPPVEVAKDVPVKPVEPSQASATPSVLEMDAPLVFAGTKVQAESDQERLLREGYTIATVSVRQLQIPAALAPSSEMLPKTVIAAKKLPAKRKGFWGFFARLFGG